MQGHKLLLAIIGGVAAFTIVTPAQALEMSAPDGWYLEGNIGSARLSNTSYPSTNKNGLAYNLNLGYKFMPYAALEGGYTKYRDSKITYYDVNVANVSRYSYDIAAKGIFPISDSGFEAFAKIGAAHMRAKASSVDSSLTDDFTSSSNATGLYVGLGGQVNIMSELAIVAQWQRAQGKNSTGTEDFFSIGVNFIFV